MLLKCGDILSLRTLKELKLVAGEDGLDRVVTWPYIVQTNSVRMWIFGGELLFFGGLGLRSDYDSLVQLLEEAEEKHAAGVIFMANEVMTPELIRSLKPAADRLGMPVFELPRESILVEITKEISGKIFEEENKPPLAEHLLERLCFGNAEAINEIVNNAAYLGIDLSVPYQVAVIYIDNLNAYLSRMGSEHNHPLPSFLTFYRQVADSIVKRYDASLLTMHDDNRIYLARKIGSEQEQSQMLQKIHGICESINGYFKGLDVYACLGGIYSYATIRSSFLEAERSLELTCRLTTKKRVSLYEDLGVYQLFFHMKEEELERYCRRWIGELEAYDRKSGAELIRTMDVFFNQRMNLNDSAAALYIHRNTMNLRIARVEKILGKSLKDAETLHGLLVGILIRNYLDRKSV
ncbi:PucR family transcriptional regulator [Paenibacillus camerounensis]|uniref:PucR family transcriptional regulator n=1 Tax=Paenibacillus camerounensis TaxID=1243663 RepID=UPI0005A834C8|nr:PucR family transcriptional regulator [Paenibacillus camerounensis]